MRMRNPPHPGEILRELCLDPLGLSVTRAAEALGVSRKTLSAILNERAGISPEMAIRLSKAFDTSAESWLNQQTQSGDLFLIGMEYPSFLPLMDYCESETTRQKVWTAYKRRGGQKNVRLLEVLAGRGPFPRVAPPYRRGIDDADEIALGMDVGVAAYGAPFPARARIDDPILEVLTEGAPHRPELSPQAGELFPRRRRLRCRHTSAPSLDRRPAMGPNQGP